jgi:hypothetical protein
MNNRESYPRTKAAKRKFWDQNEIRFVDQEA